MLYIQLIIPTFPIWYFWCRALAIRIRVANGTVKEISLDKISIRRLFKMLNLLLEEYIVIVNGRIVTEDYIVKDGDEIVLYPVVSGG